MKLYENKEKKYLEDDGVLNEVVDSANIGNYMKGYEDKLSEQEQIYLELRNLEELLAGRKANVLIERKIDLIIIMNICCYCLIGLLSKAWIPGFILAFITSIIIKLGAYAIYGTKEKNNNKIASLEEEIEQKETELLNKGQELANQKQLIDSCLENKSYVENIDYTKETKDKPLTRTLEKDK